MTNEANMPELRFPGFNGKWEIKKLKDIGDIITGKTPSTSNPKFYNGNYPFVSPLDIQNHRFIKKTNKTLSEKGFYSGRIIRKGASLFVCIGSTIGKIGQAGADVITNQQINSLIPYERYDDNFIYSNLLKSSSKIKQLAATQALPIINKETFGSYFINLPQLDEQIKIGNFFNKLDRQIELEEQKLAKLEEQKKGYMQKIFSQQLRFKGENGNDYPEWKKEIIGNIATTFSGGTPSSTNSTFYTGEIPFIRSGEISKTSTELMINEKAISNSSAKMVETGDLLYALYGATSGEVAISKINGAINQAVLCIRSQESIAYIFNYLKMKKDQILKTYIQGGQGNLSASIIKKVDIDLPNLEEQKLIGHFFNKFDDYIEIQSDKVELLKERKKGFLQKMFV